MHALQILQQAEMYFAQKLLPSYREDDRFLFLPSRQSPVVVFAVSNYAVMIEETRSIRRVIVPSQVEYAASIFERGDSGWTYKYVSGLWANIVIPEFECSIPITDLFKDVTMPLGA